MKPFTLHPLPHRCFGPGKLEALDAATLARGRRKALLVADPHLRSLGLTDRVEKRLHEAGLEVAVFESIKSDPTAPQIDEGAALARDEGSEMVVALGGGSALDVGKMIAAIAPDEQPAEHYAWAEQPFPPGGLRIACIPTTAGTGSETTATSIFSLDQGVKAWAWGDALKPDLAVLDPTFTTTLPASLTAATGVDALVHAIEACTNKNAFAANDLFCHEAIRLLCRGLPRCASQPEDLEARGQVLWAAALAGIGIDNAGTAIAHNIAHALASIAPIHHGVAAGLGMAASLSWNVEATPEPFAPVAEAMGLGPDASRLPEGFLALLDEVGFPAGLPDAFPQQPTQLASQMARPENAPMRNSNRRPVEDPDLLVLAQRVFALGR